MEKQAPLIMMAITSFQTRQIMSKQEAHALLIETLSLLANADFVHASALLNTKIDLNQLNLEQKVALRNQLFAQRAHLSEYPALMLCWARLEKLLGVRNAAEEILNQLLRQHPVEIEAIRELAWLCMENAQIPLGFEYLNQIIQLAPLDWKAWNDGGCILRSAGKTQEALVWMQKACDACPDNATLFANLALLHYDSHAYPAAQAALDRAFAIDANNPEALHTQSMVHALHGQHEEACAFDQRALAVKPDYPQARLSLALSALTLGNWQEGFAGYESRWVGSDHADSQKMLTIGRPQWSGQAVYAGSRIVVLPEQGLGDHLQFARFIPVLLNYFHHVDWVVPDVLASLMAQSFHHSSIQIHPKSKFTETLSPQLIDLECPLMSLPLALGLTVENLPQFTAKSAYLVAHAQAKAYFEKRLSEASPRIKVGLAWSGRPTLSAHKLRMVNPQLLQLLDHPMVDFVNLQKVEQGTLEVPKMSHWIDWMDECTDFSITAALVDGLDLVITTDTSMAHLSGALGKPTWMLNRAGSEWRWLFGRTDTPWYPAMRLFNQQILGDWQPVLKAVAQDLHALL